MHPVPLRHSVSGIQLALMAQGTHPTLWHGLRELVATFCDSRRTTEPPDTSVHCTAEYRWRTVRRTVITFQGAAEKHNVVSLHLRGEPSGNPPSIGKWHDNKNTTQSDSGLHATLLSNIVHRLLLYTPPWSLHEFITLQIHSRF